MKELRGKVGRPSLIVCSRNSFVALCERQSPRSAHRTPRKQSVRCSQTGSHMDFPHDSSLNRRQTDRLRSTVEMQRLIAPWGRAERGSLVNGGSMAHQGAALPLPRLGMCTRAATPRRRYRQKGVVVYREKKIAGTVPCWIRHRISERRLVFRGWGAVCKCTHLQRGRALTACTQARGIRVCGQR